MGENNETMIKTTLSVQKAKRHTEVTYKSKWTFRNEDNDVWSEKYAGVNVWLNTGEKKKMSESEDTANRNYPKMEHIEEKIILETTRRESEAVEQLQAA